MASRRVLNHVPPVGRTVLLDSITKSLLVGMSLWSAGGWIVLVSSLVSGHGILPSSMTLSQLVSRLSLVFPWIMVILLLQSVSWISTRVAQDFANVAGKNLGYAADPRSVASQVLRIPAWTVSLPLAVGMIAVFYPVQSVRFYSLTSSLLQSTGLLANFYFYFLIFLSGVAILRSFLKVWTIGESRLTLTSYIRDKTMGTSEFGRVALRLTMVNEAFVPGVILISLAWRLPQSVDGWVSVLMPLAIVIGSSALMFFLPLFPVHEKLVDAKRKEINRLTLWRECVMTRINANGDKPLNLRTSNELLAVDSALKEAEKIRTWPFDKRVLLKFVFIAGGIGIAILEAVIQTFLQRILGI